MFNSISSPASPLHPIHLYDEESVENVKISDCTCFKESFLIENLNQDNSSCEGNILLAILYVLFVVGFLTFLFLKSDPKEF